MEYVHAKISSQLKTQTGRKKLKVQPGKAFIKLYLTTVLSIRCIAEIHHFEIRTPPKSYDKEMLTYTHEAAFGNQQHRKLHKQTVARLLLGVEDTADVKQKDKRTRKTMKKR